MFIKIAWNDGYRYLGSIHAQCVNINMESQSTSVLVEDFINDLLLLETPKEFWYHFSLMFSLFVWLFFLDP
mgnify:CR=1 FL=1